MSEFATTTTVLTGLAVGAMNCYLSQDSSAFALGATGQKPQAAAGTRQGQAESQGYAGPVSALGDTFSAKGLVGFGATFGVLVAAARGAARTAGAPRRGRRAARKAAEIDVAEKTDTQVVPYFESLPRSIVDKRTLDKLLSTVPKEQWEDPPENSYLYTLKCYAETYGEGKSTKMGWWDFWYLRVNAPDADDFISGQYEVFETAYALKVMKEGAFPMEVPGPASSLPVGAWMKWRGAEPFAGDQCRTPVSAGGFAMQFLDNLAFYREGLKPWQRGLEIGMAHGYFIIGPFVSTGPLRNTPEAATVGLLCGCAIIGIVSVGGLIFGSTVKPTRFDKPGDAPAAGYQEMINWHALGGLGGAGFAHALITIFGS